MRRDNNFDLIRLVLAWIVVGAHCYDLSASPALLTFSLFMRSQVAVEGFFAISGCLIIASWDRSRSWVDYCQRRAKRILPAYWLAIAMSLFIGSLMTTLPLASFWRSVATWKYIFFNLTLLNFLHPDLPGVFQKNPLSAMDGALWTIKIEVAFYIAAPPLIWLIRKLHPGPVIAVAFISSIAFRMLTGALGKDNLGKQLPGQLAFFMVGAAVYYYFDTFSSHPRWMWGIAITATAGGFLTGWLPFEAIGIPLLVICAAFLLPAHRGITRFGDFSYGTYVLHFPIIQAFVALGFFAIHPFLTVGFVILTVATASVISWFAVERPFLRPNRVLQQENVAVGSVS